MRDLARRLDDLCDVLPFLTSWYDGNQPTPGNWTLPRKKSLKETSWDA